MGFFFYCMPFLGTTELPCKPRRIRLSASFAGFFYANTALYKTTLYNLLSIAITPVLRHDYANGIHRKTGE